LSLLPVLGTQGLAPLSYLRVTFLEFLKLYDPRLVGVYEPPLLPRETPQVSLELLRLGVHFVAVFQGGAGEILKLTQEPLGVSH
jgi:hypothetical protein